jgi:hypothetical protein
MPGHGKARQDVRVFSYPRRDELVVWLDAISASPDPATVRAIRRKVWLRVHLFTKSAILFAVPGIVSLFAVASFSPRLWATYTADRRLAVAGDRDRLLQRRRPQLDRAVSAQNSGHSSLPGDNPAAP